MSDEPVSGTNDLEPIRDLLRGFCGLDFPNNREQALRRATERVMEEWGAPSTPALAARLADPLNATALEDFAASLTIGETHFFRNQPQLGAIRSTVLPELIDQHRVDRRLRIWSAGCATGEEPYSLAIMLDELLPPEETWDVLILATDINRLALARAREGVYGSWSFRQVPGDIIGRHFSLHDGEFHLSERLRRMVAFDYLNLAEAEYAVSSQTVGDMDLILCRNVLIYFPGDIAEEVVRRLDGALAPGGWLVTGHAESPMPIFRQRFDAREFPLTILYTKRPSLPAVPDRPFASSPPPVESIATGRSAESPPAFDATPMGLPSTEHHTSDAESLGVHASALAGTQELAEAERTICQAIEHDPLSAPHHYLHGLILTELGRDADAFEALRRATYLCPDFPLAHYLLGLNYLSAGQAQRAVRELETVLAQLIADADDATVDGGDGLTVSGLRQLAVLQLDRAAAETRVP